jgi:hypothetical protein
VLPPARSTSNAAIPLPNNSSRHNPLQIAVSSINIGPINKKDIMRANAMIERGHRKFGVILAFDVPGGWGDLPGAAAVLLLCCAAGLCCTQL